MEHLLMGFNDEDAYRNADIVHGTRVATRNLTKLDNGSFHGHIEFHPPTGRREWRLVVGAYLSPYLGEIV